MMNHDFSFSEGPAGGVFFLTIVFICMVNDLALLGQHVASFGYHLGMYDPRGEISFDASMLRGFTIDVQNAADPRDGFFLCERVHHRYYDGMQSNQSSSLCMHDNKIQHVPCTSSIAARFVVKNSSQFLQAALSLKPNMNKGAVTVSP